MRLSIDSMSRCQYLLLLLLLPGCAGLRPVPVTQGAVPARLQQMELKVLRESDQFREKLKISGAIYQDPALEAYLNDLLRPLEPELPAGSPVHFQVKLVRDPTLNAFTLANGDLFFNTGLIARLSTADEFVFVAGHEMMHVLNRDLAYLAYDMGRKTITWKLADLVVTPATAVFGVAGVGELGTLTLYAASVTGYGRERERAADAQGLEAMRKAGFDGRHAINVFTTFMEEEQLYQKRFGVSFLSSHPDNKARQEAVRAALGSETDLSQSWPVDERFLSVTHNLRLVNAAADIQLSRCHHAEQELRVLLARAPEDAQVHYLLGETYRAIAENPERLKREVRTDVWREIKAQAARPIDKTYWMERAADAYETANATDADFPEAYRGLGLLANMRNEPERAVEYLKRYLQLAPQAKDRRFVNAMIAQLQAAPRPEGKP